MNHLLVMLMFLYMKKRKHTRYQKKFYRSIDAHSRRIRNRRIPRISLQDPTHTAWKALYNSQNDQAMITLTGFDCDTFHWLAGLFTPLYDQFSPFVSQDGEITPIDNSRGRKRLLQAVDALGMTLAWTRTRGSTMTLQMIFGMTDSSVSMYLRFGRRILVRVLKQNVLSRISVPSPEKIHEFCQAVQERHPTLADVWCTMDGLKLMWQT